MIDESAEAAGIFTGGGTRSFGDGAADGVNEGNADSNRLGVENTISL